ncbi:hypothetical protein TNCV_4826121 [Trichonephila clavipes]|uniref:Uncharacterized protein n=1 Tax=Trichonephila clavipes TaxID=2585209 RepID=A0A8X6V5V0_TRICX|nr:hypothetical protein TNCV_4826121 [Trichonephila clavipes]
MPSTYRCAVSGPLTTTKGVQFQKKWLPDHNTLLRARMACNSESRIGALPWPSQTHLRLSSGHRWKRDSSLNTIRPQSA